MFQKCLLSFFISSFFISQANGQTSLEITLKCTKDFRMQIFYTGSEITNNWSEKITTFKWIRQSDEYAKYIINLKTKEKLNNLRVDFGDIPQNIIGLESIRLENSDSTYLWNSQLIFEEFYMNQELRIEKATSDELVLRTVDIPEVRNIDPFIHLFINNNRLVNEAQYFHTITLNMTGNKNNNIIGTFWIEGHKPYNVAKFYSPGSSKVSFNIFAKGKMTRSVFRLGDVLDTEYDIVSFNYKSYKFQRILMGSDILKYFRFNGYTEVYGEEILHVDTRIYEGQFGPGFYSTREIISSQVEILMFFSSVLIFIVMSVLFFYFNPYLLSDRFNRLFVEVGDFGS